MKNININNNGQLIIVNSYKQGRQIVKWNDYFQATATYIGAVIGAGFISGQEILQFFVVYGTKGLLGTLIAGFLFAGLAASIIFIGTRLQITDYYNLFYSLGGRKIGTLIDILFSLFLLGSLLVMLAGCKEVFNYMFTAAINWGLIITIVVIAVTNLYGLQGIMKLNGILIPFLLVISLLVVVLLNDDFSLSFSPLNWSAEWLTSSFIYVGYNIMLGLVVLLPLTIKVNKLELIWGVGSGGLSLGLLAFMIGFTLYSFYPTIVNSELPMLKLVKRQNLILYYIYGLALWMAMITTASCNLYGILKRCSNLMEIERKKLIASILIIILPIMRLPFSRLVELIYPWLGRVSLGLLAGIIIIYIGRGVYNGREYY